MGKNYRIAEWRILTVSEFDRKKLSQFVFTVNSYWFFIFGAIFYRLLKFWPNFTDYWSWGQNFSDWWFLGRGTPLRPSYMCHSVQNITRHKRVLKGPWIIHLNPGTWCFGLWLTRYHLNIFLCSFCLTKLKGWAILVEGIMRNISVKLFWIWNIGSSGDIIYRYFLSRALVALLFSWLEPFVQF